VQRDARLADSFITPLHDPAISEALSVTSATVEISGGWTDRESNAFQLTASGFGYVAASWRMLNGMSRISFQPSSYQVGR
jgi:hypothetical protein